MKAIDKAKSFLKKYRHAWVLSYFLIYITKYFSFRQMFF